jgi:flagellar biosynthesis protein FlhA
MLFILLVPLPPALMDVLLAANMALAAVVLLTAVLVFTPLEFSVFPSVLLGTTLLRLALNVATTRLVLTAGADGRGIEEAQLAAGQVVWSFGSFVAGNSLAVGAILFAILVVVQFVVVTKGASRISEVAARFVLDAMPGKQAAIEADLAAKLIDDVEARQRRGQIAREADFYGAMDGASKFLRGDAVAAVLIIFINILGGLYVGMAQYGWSLEQTAGLFTRLTIGDGLVTQIPAFLISIGAALVITRSTARSDLGAEVLSQLGGRPMPLAVTGGFLLLLAFTPLPKLPLLLVAGGCVGLAVMLSRKQGAGTRSGAAARGGGIARGGGADGGAPAGVAGQVQQVEHLLAVDALSMELGYALVRLVDESAGGDLLGRIASVRKQIATELGVVVPPVRIRDNLSLDARGYAIGVRGTRVAAGRMYPGLLLAVAGEHTAGKLLGRETNEPASGMPAVWISPSQREAAERMHYAVLDAAGVLAGHLAETIRRHAAELLSRERVMELLAGLRPTAGHLVEESLRVLTAGRIQKVLQALLRERAGVRDLEAILEAMLDAAAHSDDPAVICEHVRHRLGRALSQQYCDAEGRLWCVAMDEQAEQRLCEHAAMAGGLSAAAVPVELGGRLSRALGDALGSLRKRGKPPVVVCSGELRAIVRQIIASAEPDAAVLAYGEIDTVEVHSVERVRIEA